MKKRKVISDDEYDRKLFAACFFLLLPLMIVSIFVFSSVEIALMISGGVFLIAVGYLSIKYSIIAGDYMVFHWRGKIARLMGWLLVLVGVIIIAASLYSNNFGVRY